MEVISMPGQGNLSREQIRFCELYAGGYSSTQAYQEAYGQQSREAARSGAQRLLKKDYIHNLIVDMQKEVYKRMNPDMVRKSNLYEGLLKRYANNPEILEKLATVDKYKPLKEANKTLNNKLIDIRNLGPIVIFTTIYRFVGPVVVTPFANWISEKIQPHKKSA